MSKCECKECIHEKVCRTREFPSIEEILKDGCQHFKNKSLFVELPCKVGDVVYVITEKHPCYACMCVDDFCHKHCTVKDKSKLVVKEAKVYYFLFQKSINTLQVEVAKAIHLVMHFLHFSIEDFGKTVFLTKEEAEKKLKEMEVGGNDTCSS